MSLLVIFIPELEIIVSLGKYRAQFLTTIMVFMGWDAAAPPPPFFFFYSF